MSAFKVICCLLLPAIVLALPPSFSRDEEVLATLEKNPRLQFLGQVGKKKFYFEPTHMNWANADNCCTTAGLNLVSLENPNESDFLKNVGLPISVWTSGRDVGSSEQFRWRKGKKITRINFGPFQRQTCLLFHPFTGLNDRLCTATWPSVCEST